jgi:hypothetical protein
MKRNILLLVLSVLFFFNSQAQIPPQAFNYSAVARDAQSNPISSQTIGIQITVHQTTTIGPIVYSEDHFVNTDQYGLFNLIIGAGAIQSGSMSTINWSADNYFLKVGMDATGGTSFLTMGTTQLISVPYAIHAATADSLIGGGSISETDPIYSASVASGITAGDTTNWNADVDSNNELQTISISNDTIYLSNGGFAVLPANAGGGGKTHLILSGDITDAQAALKIQNEVGTNTQFVLIKNTTNLTTVDLSSITDLVELKLFNNAALSNVNISNLTAVYEKMEIKLNTSLGNILFTSMLQWPDNIWIEENSVLGSLSLPNYSEARGLQILNNPFLTSIDLSSLTDILSFGIGFGIGSNSSLTTLLTPNLTNIYSTGVSIYYNALLSSIDLSSVFDITATDCNFSFNQLTSANVNLILDRLVNSATPIQSGSWLTLNGQTPAAPPTGQGVTDAATLTGMGASLTTD